MEGPAPWLALFGIVVPVALILSQQSHQLHGSVIRYLAIPWQFGVRYQTGLTLAEDITVFVSLAAALIVWSWTAGLALESLSRHTIWIHGALFCLIATFPVWMLWLAQHPWVGTLLLLWNTALSPRPRGLGHTVGRSARHSWEASHDPTRPCDGVCHSVGVLDGDLATARSGELERGCLPSPLQLPKRVLPYLALMAQPFTLLSWKASDKEEAGRDHRFDKRG